MGSPRRRPDLWFCNCFMMPFIMNYNYNKVKCSLHPSPTPDPDPYHPAESRVCCAEARPCS